jgi:murein tripeptide amidase MpaA
MVKDVQAVAAAHPSTVHLFSLGVSYEGRDLIGARVSNDANDNLSEPGVFYVGQHHAREHLTVEVVLSLLHLYADSPRLSIRRLVESRQIYIVPSLNPDGAEYDLIGDAYHFWRKNRQPTPTPGIYGTDQNRNYTYRWGCCGGSSGNPSSETYRGPSPLSTPEDSRMADFMLAHPNVKTGISYHTYGDLILYPYGYTYEDIPPDMTVVDHQTFVAMGQEMERTAGYHAQQSSDLYITDGDWNDWMYGALHRYPITIEMSGGGFYPPDEFIPGESRRNWEAALFVARIADCPTRIVGVACS